MAKNIPGTEGYSDEAKTLFKRYEAIPFETGHAKILDLIPDLPSSALDIGAGTGRDAAYLASKGHTVTAVEPTDALRLPAMQHHPSPNIRWVDDYLPDLKKLRAGRPAFDLVMMTAVWMHLDAAARRRAMPVIASLLNPGGRLIMSLRHGPVPNGRKMFDVSGTETIDLAAQQKLILLRSFETESLQNPNKQAGVTWTRLAFEKPA